MIKFDANVCLLPLAFTNSDADNQFIRQTNFYNGTLLLQLTHDSATEDEDW